MRKALHTLAGTVMAALTLVAPARAEKMQIHGAGATFPYPVYAKWAEAYHRRTGTQLNYQSIGSGGGIRQIKAGTVDFGASDAPMKPEELSKHGLFQWPQVMGGVVPVANLPGLKPGQIRLGRQVLAEIFLGRITRWNDPAVQELNPGIELPALNITVVHRADGSGTTYLFTHYLSAISDQWKKRVGTGKAVSWPVGVGGKGNEGVASYVGRIKGSIGYVEFAYALQNRLTYTRLQNREGDFVAPSMKAFQAAAANADWQKARGYHLLLTDQPGKDSWPITGASFILVHRKAANPRHTMEVLKFFDWAFRNGRQLAEELHYVPMPENVVNMVRKDWAGNITDAATGKPLWPTR